MVPRKLLSYAWSLAVMCVVTTIPSVISIRPAEASGPTISAIVSSASAVPQYAKLELTFQITTLATNPQLPYDPVAAPGLSPRLGVTVDGLFLPPGQGDWSQALVQPGFLYQDYQYQQLNGHQWLYPNGGTVWKIRFAPTQQGSWQYQIRVQDSSICATGVNPCPNWNYSPIGSFTATPPLNHGFIQVSPTDHRYFQFNDGTYFVGLGTDTSFQSIAGAQQQFTADAANGVQLLRAWMDGSDIAGSSWNPWVWFGGPTYGGYMPDPGLWINPEKNPVASQYNPNSTSPFDFTFDILYNPSVSWSRPCLFNGWSQGPIAVKPNTTYKVTVTALPDNITGPRDATNLNFGLTVKVFGWPNATANTCPDALGTAPALVPHINSGTSWQTVTGQFTTDANENFLGTNGIPGYLFLEMDNANSGSGAHVGQVLLQEVSSGGALGPNLLAKSSGQLHEDFNQPASYMWDQIIDAAAQNNVFLKLVILEHNDRVWNFIDWNGSMDQNGGPDNFYAQDGTKVRALQSYFWRYLSARWGYSTAIHSWELNNEGDPYNGNHYDQTNKFAAYIRQYDRNQLVTTSFWHDYPASQFWNNANYPNPGYSDLHAYTTTGPLTVPESDDAGLHIAYSQWVHGFGVPKPTVRGETGIANAQGEDPALARDVHGVWLHNFAWAQLDSGGMYDLYWYVDDIVKNNLYFQYQPVYRFLSSIPLNNGHYQDSQASATASNVRVIGQKDRVSGRAHLWIQNTNHNWSNVVNGVSWGTLSGTVTVPGLLPNHTYPVEWWLFDDPGNRTVQYTSITTDSAGNLVLNLATLPGTVTDTAVKIGDYSQAFAFALSPAVK